MCKNAKFLIVIVLFVLSAQTEVTGQTMVTVFSESFKNNHNKWNEINSFEHLAAILKDGYFIRNRYNEQYFITDKQIKFDTDSNFVIETTIKKKAGINRDGFGLSWGRKNGHNAYSFTLASNGSFDIGKWDEDKWVYLVSKKCEFINRGKKENKLKVEKKGDIYNFYINDKWVETKPAEPIEGSKVGYIIYNQISILVSSLKVTGKPTETLGSAISSAKRVVQTEPDSANEQTITGQPIIVPEVTKESEVNKQVPQSKANKANFETADGASILVTEAKVFDKTGDYKNSYILGNGNGQLERGEAVKVTLTVFNNSDLIQNGSVTVQQPRKSGYMLSNTVNEFTISNFDQADMMKLEFELFVAKNFSGSKVQLQLLVQSKEGTHKIPLSLTLF